MTLQEAHVLIDYHYWARDRLLDAVLPLSPEQLSHDLGNSFRSIRETLVHIYSAEWVWLSRWEGHSPTAMLSADHFPSIEALREGWRQQEERLRAFFDGMADEDLTRRIDYKSLGGTPATSVLAQMLQQVVNHGSYHRGQVTTMLRQLGMAPPKSMDLITFYRERG